MAKIQITSNKMVTIELEETTEHVDLIGVKPIQDSDGFWTEYTWYQREDGTHFFIYGDSDIYGPEDTPDWECESWREAYDWFSNYTGCYEEDEDEEEYENLDLEDLLDHLLG